MRVSSNDVTLSVVIVTYNSSQHIGALLDSLPEALGSVSHSVTVVDNGSSDGTADLVEARGGVAMVRSTNTGFAAGINAGVRAFGEEGPILVLNPDAVLMPGSVTSMLKVMERSPEIGIVAPRMLEQDGSLSPSIRREPTLCRAGGLSFTGLAAFAERVEDLKEYEIEHVVDWAVGAVLLISRACFDALGGFDESYFLYSEETDFCLRARDLGWLTIYTPSAHVMHIGGGSGETTTTHTMKMVNRVRIYGRRHGAVSAHLYFAVVVLTELRRAILGHKASWSSFRALVRPRLRPRELSASETLVPK